MSNPVLSLLSPLGRLLLASIFVISGFTKMLAPTGVAGAMAQVGLPSSALLAFGVGALELVAGTALALGYRTRWAAVALALFTALATVLFHNYWAMPADEQFVEQLLFSKNVAIVGALLFTTAVGAGPWSLDSRTDSRGHANAATPFGAVGR